MADELTQKLQELLSNPDAQNLISSLMNSRTQNSPSQDSSDSSAVLNTSAPVLKNIINSTDISGDKRINLLNALKPYMSSGKASSIDKAIKMLKITQLSSILKDI